jgi:hypothetical protein
MSGRIPRLFSVVHVNLRPRVAAVTLPLPGLLLRMQRVHNADFCPLHPAVVLAHAQPDLVLEDWSISGQLVLLPSQWCLCWLLGSG